MMGSPWRHTQLLSLLLLCVLLECASPIDLLKRSLHRRGGGGESGGESDSDGPVVYSSDNVLYVARTFAKGDFAGDHNKDLAMTFVGEKLFLLDGGNSCLYQFEGHSGDTESGGKKPFACYNKHPGGAKYSGLAADVSGEFLYISQEQPGGVYQVNAHTGLVTNRLGNSALPGAGALAVDPSSGDVFAAQNDLDNEGDALIYRFSTSFDDAESSQPQRQASEHTNSKSEDAHNADDSRDSEEESEDSENSDDSEDSEDADDSEDAENSEDGEDSSENSEDGEESDKGSSENSEDGEETESSSEEDTENSEDTESGDESSDAFLEIFSQQTAPTFETGPRHLARLNYRTLEVYAKLPGKVRKIAFGLGGTMYALAGNTLFKLPYAKKGRSIPVKMTKTRQATGIAISGDGGYVVVSHEGGKITTINVKSLEVKAVFSDGSQFGCVAMGPDGCIYAARVGNVIKLSNRPDGGCLQSEEDISPENEEAFKKARALAKRKRRWVEEHWKKYWRHEQVVKQTREQAFKRSQLAKKEKLLIIERAKLTIDDKLAQEERDKTSVKAERAQKKIREESFKTTVRRHEKRERSKKEDDRKARLRAKALELQKWEEKEKLKQKMKWLAVVAETKQEAEEQLLDIKRAAARAKAARANDRKARQEQTRKKVAEQAQKEARKEEKKKKREEEQEWKLIAKLERQRDALIEKKNKKKQEQRFKKEEKKSKKAAKHQAQQNFMSDAQRAALLGRWCECEAVPVSFEEDFSTVSCPVDSLITGLFREIANDTTFPPPLVALDSLLSIRALLCCKACRADGLSILPTQKCSATDNSTLPEFVACHDNTYMQSLTRSDCEKGRCITSASCCFLQGSSGRDDKCKAAGDPFFVGGQPGWSTVSTDHFLVSLYLTSSQTAGLNDQVPYQCRYKAY